MAIFLRRSRRRTRQSLDFLMKCPTCQHSDTKVIDSRLSSDGTSIRRRRECLKCERRFTTYEYVEHAPLMVIKRDGRRQAYDRKKITAGLIKACEKRPVSVDTIEEIADQLERVIQRRYDREVTSKDIGELLMETLSRTDEVAYVRFASVYRQFHDVDQFMRELKTMLEKNQPQTRANAAQPSINIRRDNTAKGAQEVHDSSRTQQDHY